MRILPYVKSLYYLIPSLLIISNAAYAASNTDQIARGERGGGFERGGGDYHPQYHPQEQQYHPQQQQYHPQQQQYHPQQQSQGNNRYQQYQQGGANKYNNPVMHQQERQNAEMRGYTQGVEEGAAIEGGSGSSNYYNPYPAPTQNQYQSPYQNPYQNQNQNQNDPFFYQ